MVRQARQRLAADLPPVPVRLHDGATVRLRPVVPDDRWSVLHNPGRASAKTLYRRFFRPGRPSPEELGDLADADCVDHFAWVALDDRDVPVGEPATSGRMQTVRRPRSASRWRTTSKAAGWALCFWVHSPSPPGSTGSRGFPATSSRRTPPCEASSTVPVSDGAHSRMGSCTASAPSPTRTGSASIRTRPLTSALWWRRSGCGQAEASPCRSGRIRAAEGSSRPGFASVPPARPGTPEWGDGRWGARWHPDGAVCSDAVAHGRDHPRGSVHRLSAAGEPRPQPDGHEPDRPDQSATYLALRL